MKMGQAKTIINLYKNGSSVNSISYMTGLPVEEINEVVKVVKYKS